MCENANIVKPAPTLVEPGDTIAILKKYGFSFQKKYGQNFLIDTRPMEKIISAADINERDFVIEIGPGIGTLTQQLAYRAGAVCAIEIDKRLMDVLDETLSGYDNVTVINDDVMKVDLRGLADSMGGGRAVKVVANLPYYITTPVIMSLLEGGIRLKSAVVMVQKEVAERMRAHPGTKEYGALSLAVQYYAGADFVANVPPNCFMPRPGVASAVVALRPYESPPVKTKDAGRLFEIIHASFEQRRKTLANGLYNCAGLQIPKSLTESVLTEMGLPANVRGEQLSLEQFARLADLLG